MFGEAKHCLYIHGIILKIKTMTTKNTIKNIKRMNPEVNENALNKLNKIKLNVTVEKKVDNRVNNTGRPVNLKSARQVRLAKQKLYTQINEAFINSKKFKIDNDTNSEYKYVRTDDVKDTGSIVCAVTNSHVCNVNYIGRTKVTGYTFVLGRCVNVMINLKEVKFV